MTVTDHAGPRTAIVTGAGSSGPGVGIGKGVAVTLARDGYRVALVDRSRVALEETHEIIVADGFDAIPIFADVSDEDDCRRIVESTVSAFGSVDVLVNNVGIFGPGGGLAGVE